MVNRIKKIIFKNTSLRQTVLKNLFWLGTSQTVSKFVKAIVIIYAARILGAAEYGLFSYILGFAGFFAIFSDIGVSGILTREVARNSKDESNYFATILAIKTTLLLLTAGIIVFIAPYFIKIEAAAVALPLVAILLVFDNFRDLSVAFFRGKERMELEAITVVLTNVSIGIFGFITLHFWANYKSLFIAYILGSLIGLVAALFFLKERLFHIKKYFSKRLILPIINSAWPFAVGGLVGSFMFNIDVIMLGWWRSSFELGLYSAAQKIIGLLYNMSGLIAIATFPVFTRFVHEGNGEKAKKLITDTIAALFLVSIPIVIGGIILRRDIIQFVFGSEYKDASAVFAVLLTSVIVIFPFSILNSILFVYDKQSKMLGYVSIASLINVALNIILISRYGIMGAAIATILANTFSVAMLWRLIKKINHFTILFRLPKILLASVLMGAATIFLNKIGIHLLVNIAFSIVVYFALLYLLNEEIVIREFSRFKLKLKS